LRHVLAVKVESPAVNQKEKNNINQNVKKSGGRERETSISIFQKHGKSVADIFGRGMTCDGN
jgi:hypothetical protein